MPTMSLYLYETILLPDVINKNKCVIRERVIRDIV